MKNTIQNYLHTDSKMLGSLLNKLTQLKRLNQLLKDSLGDDANIMDHCHVVNITGNTLIVIADSSHWLTRIRFYIPELLPKLRLHSGLEHLKAISCKVQPNSDVKISKKSLRGRLKLKSETADKILESTKQVKDQKIKAILEKIASRSR